MSRAKDTAKFIVSSLVLGCIAYFFYRTFKLNWATVRAQKIEFGYGYLSAATLCIFATYLVTTYGWQLTTNALSKAGRLSFPQTLAVVNASSLTKYVPGKIWSYALQMYWLSAAGFSKSLVVYVNAINLFISLVTSMMVGLIFLLPAPGHFPLVLTVGSLVALLVVDIVALRFHDGFFRWLVTTYNRLRQRNLQYFETSTKLLVVLHLLHLFAAFAFALSAYFTCLGIGYHVGIRQAPLFMASLLLSDTIAFAAVIVPGGLGVREGIMYAMLGGAASGPVALTLPVATRILHMLVDVVLGVTALRLLRKLNARAPAVPEPAEASTSHGEP
jgi:uncharacterized membrane protein YbhN (UPF0104 family)